MSLRSPSLALFKKRPQYVERLLAVERKYDVAVGLRDHHRLPDGFATLGNDRVNHEVPGERSAHEPRSSDLLAEE